MSAYDQGCGPGPSQARVSLTLFFKTKNDELVYICGDFNDWQLQEMNSIGYGVYSFTLSVLEGTRYIRYKFRVGNGTWLYDQHASVEPDGFNGFNNILDVEEHARDQHDEVAETVVWDNPELRTSNISIYTNDGPEAINETDEIKSVSDYLSGSEYEVISMTSEYDETASQSEFLVI